MNNASQRSSILTISSTPSSSTGRPNYLIKSQKPTQLQGNHNNTPTHARPESNNHGYPDDYEPIPHHLKPAVIMKQMMSFRSRLSSVKALLADIESNANDDIAMFMIGEDEYLDCDEDIV